MKTQPTKYLIGPHHGEYSFETPNTKCQSINIYDLQDQYPDTWNDEFQKLIKGCQNTGSITSDEDAWGTFTIIQFESADSIIKDFYKNWAMNELQARVIEAFTNASGDDSTFDYIPSFIEAYQQLVQLVYPTDYEYRIKRLRHALYILDRDYPEFFTDDELKDWDPDRITESNQPN